MHPAKCLSSVKHSGNVYLHVCHCWQLLHALLESSVNLKALLTRRSAIMGVSHDKRRFPFNEKFRFEFPETYRNFREKGQSCKVLRNFRKFLTRNYRSIDFPSEIFCCMIRFSEIRQFFGFSESFPKHFFTINLPPFRNFRFFLLNGNRPILPGKKYISLRGTEEDFLLRTLVSRKSACN